MRILSVDEETYVRKQKERSQLCFSIDLSVSVVPNLGTQGLFLPIEAFSKYL